MAIEDVIKDNLKDQGITAAILFGSFIEKGEYRDIDILIVLEQMDNIASIRNVLCEIDADIDPSFITAAEFEESISTGDPFYLNVLKGEPVIGSEYVERCREKACSPSGEIIRRYRDLSVHAHEKVKLSKEYFDCYVSCKFLIEYLMMKHGGYVIEPHRYDSYLLELGLPLDSEDIYMIARILMHRRGDAELREGDVERAIRIIGEILALEQPD